MSDTIDRFAVGIKERLREENWYMEGRDTESSYTWIDWAVLNAEIDELCAKFKAAKRQA